MIHIAVFNKSKCSPSWWSLFRMPLTQVPIEKQIGNSCASLLHKLQLVHSLHFITHTGDCLLLFLGNVSTSWINRDPAEINWTLETHITASMVPRPRSRDSVASCWRNHLWPYRGDMSHREMGGWDENVVTYVTYDACTKPNPLLHVQLRSQEFVLLRIMSEAPSCRKRMIPNWNLGHANKMAQRPHGSTVLAMDTPLRKQAPSSVRNARPVMVWAQIQ